MNPDARETFAIGLVRFHLEELNGVLDRLVFLAVHRDDEPGCGLALAAARCMEMLDALAWNREEVVRLTWHEAERPPDWGEDLAGAALVLKALDADRERCRTWVRGLPAEARRRLAGALRELRKNGWSVGARVRDVAACSRSSSSASLYQSPARNIRARRARATSHEGSKRRKRLRRTAAVRSPRS